MGPSVFVCSDALEHNLRHLIGVSGGRPAFPVIKANAYGHGAALVAKVFAAKFSTAELPIFCVARSVELEALLPLKLKQDFLVLSQIDWDWHLSQPNQSQIVWTLGSDSDLDVWRSSAKLMRGLKRVHLKINSGMNRLGLSLRQLESLIPLLKTCVKNGLQIEGVYTHFWNSDGDSSKESLAQLEAFSSAIDRLAAEGLVDSSTWIHAENSASLRWHLPLPKVGRSAFRPGIHLWGYGLDKAYQLQDDVCSNLLPAMAVGAPVRQVRVVSTGEGLSYGWRYKAKQSEVYVASVSLGYADGIPRVLSWNGEGAPGGYLVIDGKKCPIISTVTMDMVMVQLDAAHFEQLKAHAGVSYAYWIHPKFQSAAEVASWLKTITYEVLCMISARVPRMIKGSSESLP